MTGENKTPKPNAKLWEMVQQGILSTAEYTKRTGMRVLLGGKRHHSKYTYKQLREMHAKGIRIKNPKIAAHVQSQHESWYAKNQHRFVAE